MNVYVWLGIMVMLLGIEVITVALTTIWFAFGALAALIGTLCGLGVWGQLILFFVVSLVLLIFTRPFAVKFVMPHKVLTNYEELVDKTIKITEAVDNINGTGAAVLNGQEWTVRMQQDTMHLPEGELARVVAVEGVKLIVAPIESME